MYKLRGENMILNITYKNSIQSNLYQELIFFPNKWLIHSKVNETYFRKVLLYPSLLVFGDDLLIFFRTE